MKLNKKVVAVAVLLVAGIALANVFNSKSYHKGGIDLSNDLASKDTASTFAVTSDTTATVMTSSVAAITLSPTATPGANDLIVEVNNAAGSSLWSVDLEGDVAQAGIASFTGGIAAGGGETITVIRACTLTDLDIGAAGAGAAAVVTGSCTGATLGDACQIGPVQDDAAWDEGSLTCFVESAGVVKLVYHADASGGDPAATNDYKVVLTRF